MTTRTCARCAAQAVRTLGSEDLCADCAETILEPIRARVLERDMLQEKMEGRGVQRGILLPDRGPRWAELECCTCHAQWTGPIGDWCWWCARSAQYAIEMQHDLLVTPPDIDPDLNEDDAHKIRSAWFERLIRGIEAEIITRDEARWAWTRSLRGIAA